MIHPIGSGSLAIHTECMLPDDIDRQEHSHLHDLLTRHHWPNILLSGLLDELCDSPIGLQNHRSRLEQVISRRRSFVDSCEQAIRRTFGTNEKFEQAIFCDAILEEAHIFVQNSDGAEHRIMHVIQNIIIKWMYAIYIPFEKSLLHLIPEISRLTSEESYGFSRRS